MYNKIKINFICTHLYEGDNKRINNVFQKNSTLYFNNYYVYIILSFIFLTFLTVVLYVIGLLVSFFKNFL